MQSVWSAAGAARCLLLVLASTVMCGARPRQEPALATVPKFPLAKSGLEWERPTRAGAFFDVLGRKAAVYGYEHRALEVWAYPLQILDNFELSFRLEGYPQEFRAADTAARIGVRPEATTITYTHAAFTVRQIIFAPVDEPAVVMLLDVESVLPLGVTVSFRPRLKPMWPAGSVTPTLRWDREERVYYVTEESDRFVGVVGSPAARDASVMPYQEEPRDVPARFHVDVPAAELRGGFVPLVIAGSVRGRADAKAAYDRALGAARADYERTARYYRRLLEETARVHTPDTRLDESFAWAKIGVDKGFVESPLLGTGLVAGFRTAGESERPGFAWFFGRDALWTVLAINSYGDFAAARAALEFLRKYQRADGKIPHEISQSASLLPWFTDYPYAWASADATPLYLVACADYLRASGDLEFVRRSRDSVLRAYRFAAATDTDGDGLVENTAVGHGWVEGGALYPPHEEIYMQGVWVAALAGLREMAAALGDEKLAGEAASAAGRAREALERTYWLEDRGFYAFATSVPRAAARKADPGPNLAERQARMNELDRVALVDEDTVMPAVPLWFGALAEERAQSQLDHLGAGGIATDWGARIISDESRLYDPLSYHNGSVWPLFTGWASVAAYRYGRPHVGLQALMANVLLKRQGALGYVTELLSGEFNAPFGRSSHHQVWSEAMIVTPALRGLFGVEVSEGGRALRFAPQLPADWGGAEVRGVRAGAARFDLSIERRVGHTRVVVSRRAGAAAGEEAGRGGAFGVTVAPSLPLDARVKTATVGGRPAEFRISRAGDIQRAEVTAPVEESAEIVITYEEGTDVYLDYEAPPVGARSRGLRVLRSRAGRDALRLVVEGVPGQTYGLRVRTGRTLQSPQGGGARLVRGGAGGADPQLLLTFEGPPEKYVRGEVVVPFGPEAK